MYGLVLRLLMKSFNRRGLRITREMQAIVLAKAFLDIVQGCSDETVGGFPIHVRMIDGKFDYSYSKTFQTGKEQFVKPGEAIVFDMRNSEGGFSFEQLPISEEEFMLKFDQMPQVLLYSRNKRIPEEADNHMLFGLMLPMLLFEDENGVRRRYR